MHGGRRPIPSHVGDVAAMTEGCGFFVVDAGSRYGASGDFDAWFREIHEGAPSRLVLDEIGWIAGPCGLGFFLLSPV